MLKINNAYLRNLMFGAEDSLVSSVGVLFGLASSGDYSSKLVITAGIVLITVEGLSMGVGAYLSEAEIQEIEIKKARPDKTWLDGLIMFISYIFFGILVLFPYLVTSLLYAKFISAGLAFVSLFFLGFLPTKNYKTGLRMLILGGFTTIIGYTVAKIFHT